MQGINLHHRLTKKLVFLSMLTSVAFSTKANLELDTLKLLYDGFTAKIEFTLVQDGGWGSATSPNWYWEEIANNNEFLETRAGGISPSIGIFAASLWADEHARTCTDSPQFRKMPLYNAADGFKTITTNTYKNVLIKRIYVTQNVPHTFGAKKHGGLTDLFSDSFYFWDFGDGGRKFNKNGDDHNTDYVYRKTGSYYLASVVYTEDFDIGINIGVDYNQNYNTSNTRIKPYLNQSGNLYLEGCDVAEIVVSANNAPTANSSAYTYSKGSNVTSVRVSGGNSTDPDDNPLTYVWRVNNGNPKTGQNATYTFPTPEFGYTTYNLSLTVSDGDKSDTTFRTIYVNEYCYSCNGMNIP